LLVVQKEAERSKLKMFSRFTSAAAGMAAAVSGNEIAAKYDVEPAPCATGGHRFLWKVYNAKHRKSGVRTIKERACVKP